MFFYIGHIGQDKVFYDICERKNAFIGYNDKTFKKSKNIERVLGCVSLVKNNFFFHIFNLGNIGQENLFYDILEQRNAFLGYKNKQFKKSKN